LESSGKISKPVVTEVKPLEIFYPAEEYHHNYFNKHPDQGYCQVVIRPKLGLSIVVCKRHLHIILYTFFKVASFPQSG